MGEVNRKQDVIGRQLVNQSNSMLFSDRFMVFKMADEQRTLSDLLNINIRNGLQFFDRIDNFTASNVGLAAREGDEGRLRHLLSSGKYFNAIDLHCRVSCSHIFCKLPGRPVYRQY